LRRLCEDLSKNMKLLKEDLQLLGVNELGASSVVYRIRIVANYQDIFALRREVLKEVNAAEIINNDILNAEGLSKTIERMLDKDTLRIMGENAKKIAINDTQERIYKEIKLLIS